jgi:hypothetical protein
MIERCEMATSLGTQHRAARNGRLLHQMPLASSDALTLKNLILSLSPNAVTKQNWSGSSPRYVVLTYDGSPRFKRNNVASSWDPSLSTLCGRVFTSYEYLSAAQTTLKSGMVLTLGLTTRALSPSAGFVPGASALVAVPSAALACRIKERLATRHQPLISTVK